MNINGKNINLGTNNGHIGDNYTGIQQRHFTEAEISRIVAQINDAYRQNPQLIKSHVTIGIPNDKESNVLASQLMSKLKARGFEVRPQGAMYFGSPQGKFEVDVSFDNSVLVNIYPADNV